MKNSWLPVAAWLPLLVLVFLSMSSRSVAANAGDRTAGPVATGAHVMRGTIDAVNHKTGWMRLTTGTGEMPIHYPPASVTDLKKSDRIMVHLSCRKEAAGRRQMDDRMNG